MRDIQDILDRAGLDGRETRVLLHQPSEPEFSAAAARLAVDEPEVIEVFQRTHRPRWEAAFLKAPRQSLLSFVRVDRDKEMGLTRFVLLGVYRNKGHEMRTVSDILAGPVVRRLAKTYGVYRDMATETNVARLRAWFRFERTERLTDLRGKLLIGVAAPRGYARRGEKFSCEVLSTRFTGAAA